MFNYNFNDLFNYGGVTLIILMVCSLLSLKVIIEKWLSLALFNEKSIETSTRDIKYSLKKNDLEDAMHFGQVNKKKKLGFEIQNPIFSLTTFLLNNYTMKKDELLDLTFAEMDKELVKAEKNLGILATLGNIAPFIGLFGTVLGIIKAFHGLSINESSSYLGVMSGISEALIATAAGLLVAVPSVIFYNHFIKRIKRCIPSIEKEIKEMVYILKREN
ncbi:MAG: MotA/TolQ/ExbB proton channel family protein [bacterium]